MIQLTYYTPRSPLAQLLAPAVAIVAAHLPPRARRPIVARCARLSRDSRRPGLRRRAAGAVNLLGGDGMSIRVKRQYARQA